MTIRTKTLASAALAMAALWTTSCGDRQGASGVSKESATSAAAPQDAEKAALSEEDWLSVGIVPEEWLISVAGKKAGDLYELEIEGVSYRFRWCPRGAFKMGLAKAEQQEDLRLYGEAAAAERETRGEKTSGAQFESALKHWLEEKAEEDRRGNVPKHEVTLTQGFWLLETEVTQEMWESLMGNNPSEFQGAKLPVADLGWDACRSFVAKLNLLGVAPADSCFAFPTEAQWEYACRAGTTTSYSWGDSFKDDRANCLGANPFLREGKDEPSKGPKPVGSYAPNPWGLCDMHGNVAEWCDGWFDHKYPAEPETDPRPSKTGSARVTRGGGWASAASACRSGSRQREGVGARSSAVGFRFAIVPLTTDRLRVIDSPAGAATTAEAEPTRAQQLIASFAGHEGVATPVQEWTSSFAGLSPGDLRVVNINGVSYRFRWQPPGAFTMGSPESEREEALRFDIERKGLGEEEAKADPEIAFIRSFMAGEAQRDVAFEQGFWMLETEVTQLMWILTMGNVGPCYDDVNFPVVGVSWNDCQEFIAELNELGFAPAGARFALPTEAQWEYACRAGTTSPFFWGDSLNGDKANCNGSSPYGTDAKGEYSRGVKPVGSYAANPWGLYDMHGNVKEWCEDIYEFVDYPSDAPMPRKGVYRITRGGGFYDVARDCRSASRSYGLVEIAKDSMNQLPPGTGAVGFRIVLVPLTEETSQEETTPGEEPTAPAEEPAAAEEESVGAADEAETPAEEPAAPTEEPATPAEEWTASFAGQEAGDLRVIEINGVSYRFRWQPPGAFKMGSSGHEIYRSPEERPHDVTLTQGFWALETEVTQSMWESIKGDNPSRFKGADLPVESVSWNDCQEFVAKLNDLGVAPADASFALPTEAQWEYACRADTTTAFSWGLALDGDKANCQGVVPYGKALAGTYLGKTTPVGSFEPNPWGLFDMHGNVAEWCRDGFEDYSFDPATDPSGPDNSPYRVMRGGGWFHHPRLCRSAARGFLGENSRNGVVGFRVVLVPLTEAPPQAAATPEE